MTKRRPRPDPRRVKIHRNYTIDEAAKLLGCHRNTVRNWIDHHGLSAITDHRPILIYGEDLRRFLEQRRQGAKRPCGPGQLFCVKCREPRSPALGMADYLPTTATSGRLYGICPVCTKGMNRQIALSRLPIVGADLDITIHGPALAHTRGPAPSPEL